MATNVDVKVIVGAVNNVGNVLKDIGKQIQDTLGKQSKTNVSELTKATGGLAATFTQVATGMAIAGGAIYAADRAFGAIKNSIGGMLSAAGESQRVMAQTNAVIASTGGVAGVTAEQVTTLARKIADTTPISDEAAQSAQNMLLTFTAIGKDTFPQATQAVMDLATAMNGGVTPSEEMLLNTSIQVGKALQDPILGMTNLRRVGVNFTEANKKTVEQLINSNRGMEAQKFILKELNKEFGGSSQAALNSYSGIQTALKNKIDDLAEAIGGVLMPVATDLARTFMDVLSRAVDWLSAHMVELQAYALAVAGGLQVLAQIAIGVATAIFRAFQFDFSGVGDAIINMWGNVSGTIAVTQQKIVDNTQKSMNKQVDSAKSAYNGIAIAHTASADKIAKDEEKETQDYEKQLARRKTAFEDQLTDLIFAHIDKRDSILKQIDEENDAFAKSNADKVKSFNEAMADIERSHADKVEELQKQLDEETKSVEEAQKKRELQYQHDLDAKKKELDLIDKQEAAKHKARIDNIKKNADLEIQYGDMTVEEAYALMTSQIDQENAAYTVRLESLKGYKDSELSYFITTNQMEMADEKAKDQQKIADIQKSMTDEAALYEEQKATKTANLQTETLELQTEHEKRNAEYQANLAEEEKILKAHSTEVAGVKDKVRDDDITRLQKQFDQENKDALEQHLQKMKDLKERGTAEGAAYGGANYDALDEKRKEIEEMLKKSGVTAGQNFADGIYAGAKLAGENLISQFLESAKNKVVGMVTKNPILKPISFLGLSPSEWGSLKFQTGGVVPGEIGQPVPIIAHGGEVVTPSRVAEKVSNTGSQTVFNVYVGLYTGTEIDKRNVARELYASLVQVAQSQNKTVMEYMGG